MFTGAQGNASTTAANAQPGFQQSLTNANNIDYSGYLNAANNAGQQNGMMAGIGGWQLGQYGYQANQAQGQQQNLYNTGNQVMNRAMDPNMAQYNQTANNLGGQVNAGQAARGLGNSPVGGQEYNNTMANFNTGWNTQQLQNEINGAQSMVGLSNAGGQQGQLVGANLSGMMNVGSQIPGYTMASGQVPTQAQQYVGQQPGAASSAYTTGMGGLETMYGNAGNMAIQYMNGGIGATQVNSAYNQNQNNGIAGAAGAAFNGMANSANTPGSWLNNMFGSNSGGGGGSGSLATNNSSSGQTYSDNSGGTYNVAYGGT
jgi:hypothetical protein